MAKHTITPHGSVGTFSNAKDPDEIPMGSLYRNAYAHERK